LINARRESSNLGRLLNKDGSTERFNLQRWHHRTWQRGLRLVAAERAMIARNIGVDRRRLLLRGLGGRWMVMRTAVVRMRTRVFVLVMSLASTMIAGRRVIAVRMIVTVRQLRNDHVRRQDGETEDCRCS